MFLCVNCRARLVRVTNERGVFWVCPECDSRLVALSLVRKVAARDFINELWRTAITSRAISRVQCPICAAPMRKVTQNVAGQNLALDVCKNCQVLWFDPKEFERVPVAPPPSAEPELSLEARALIAQAKIEAMKAQATRPEISTGTSSAPDEWWKWLPGLLRLPVEYDTNDLRRYPIVTWALVAMCVVATFIGWLSREVVMAFAFIPGEMAHSGGATLLTSFFFHGGVLHLLGNMYFLWVFGDNVEDFLGRWRYLLLIAAATIAGDWVHALFEPRSLMPTIGASGGISGIIVFYALQFPQARLGWVPFSPIPWWIRMPAAFALLLWILYQGALVLLQIGGMTNVSALAHLGGAGTGFVAWLFWRKST